MSRHGGNVAIMYIVYILKNNISGRHYIGSINNIERRLLEHNRGQTRSTKGGKWSLIYVEKYQTSKESKDREKKIKSYKGGNEFKKLLNMRE